MSLIPTSLSGGHVFTKNELAQSYQQLLLQLIVTYKCASRVIRLRFGISSAPEIFPNFIKLILNGTTGVVEVNLTD